MRDAVLHTDADSGMRREWSEKMRPISTGRSAIGLEAVNTAP